jgi:hypothetical protein
VPQAALEQGLIKEFMPYQVEGGSRLVRELARLDLRLKVRVTSADEGPVEDQMNDYKLVPMRVGQHFEDMPLPEFGDIVFLRRRPQHETTIKDIAALAFAASRNFVDSMRTMLFKTRVDPNSCDYDGRTALHVAVNMEQIEAIQVLLEAGADPYIVDTFGLSAVDIARDHGRDDILAMLEEAQGGAALKATELHVVDMSKHVAAKKEIKVATKKGYSERLDKELLLPASERSASAPGAAAEVVDDEQRTQNGLLKTNWSAAASRMATPGRRPGDETSIARSSDVGSSGGAGARSLARPFSDRPPAVLDAMAATSARPASDSPRREHDSIARTSSELREKVEQNHAFIQAVLQGKPPLTTPMLVRHGESSPRERLLATTDDKRAKPAALDRHRSSSAAEVVRAQGVPHPHLVHNSPLNMSLAGDGDASTFSATLLTALSPRAAQGRAASDRSALSNSQRRAERTPPRDDDASDDIPMATINRIRREQSEEIPMATITHVGGPRGRKGAAGVAGAAPAADGDADSSSSGMTDVSTSPARRPSISSADEVPDAAPRRLKTAGSLSDLTQAHALSETVGAKKRLKVTERRITPQDAKKLKKKKRPEKNTPPPTPVAAPALAASAASAAATPSAKSLAERAAEKDGTNIVADAATGPLVARRFPGVRATTGRKKEATKHPLAESRLFVSTEDLTSPTELSRSLE